MARHALAKRNEEKVQRAKGQLTADQILFAEWLALPSIERQPKNQKLLARQLGVTE